MKVHVPEKARRSLVLQIKGEGSSDFGGFFGFDGGCIGECGSGPGGRPSSFDELLDSFSDAPHNNELTATLSGRRGVVWDDLKVLDRVVKGRHTFFLKIAGVGGGGSGSSGGGGQEIPVAGR
jgi:hypothetical protein